MIKLLLTFYFKLSGWRFVSIVPDELRSYVFVGAPHTSNHDFIPSMAVATLMNRNAKFIIKNEMLKFPLKTFLISMGAVGVDRTKNRMSLTDTMAQLFKDIPDLALMISPEGTRGPNNNWKTGFYYTAQKAGVPIVLGYADYAKKEAGLGKIIFPRDFESDMKEIMEFYRTVTAKKPENFRLDEKHQ